MQFIWLVAARKPSEFGHVNDTVRLIELQRIATGHDQRFAAISNFCQGLPQVVPGPLIARVAPQERGEFLAPLGMLTFDGQESEQGLSLPGNEGHRLAIRLQSLETAENVETEGSCHGCKL